MFSEEENSQNDIINEIEDWKFEERLSKEFIAASMTMDISNQNKLSEFYEELKRLKIEITRPDINNCFADFRTIDDKFYYALGGIKAVGYEAISNIVKERTENGKFQSINDF